jgi:hypothetical protein
VIGKHIGNAQTKFGDSQRWLDRFEARLEQAVDEDALAEQASVEAGDQLRAIDAA